MQQISPASSPDSLKEPTTKLCHCGEKTTAKGLCHSHYYIEYRKRNKAKGKAYTKKWREANRDKIKASNALRRKRYNRYYSSSLTRDTLLELLKLQKDCASCSRPFTEDLVATLDHKRPISRGGRHELDNLHLLCFSCNSSKKDKTWEEFCEYKSNLAR